MTRRRLHSISRAFAHLSPASLRRASSDSSRGRQQAAVADLAHIQHERILRRRRTADRDSLLGLLPLGPVGLDGVGEELQPRLHRVLGTREIRTDEGTPEAVGAGASRERAEPRERLRSRAQPGEPRKRRAPEPHRLTEIAELDVARRPRLRVRDADTIELDAQVGAHERRPSPAEMNVEPAAAKRMTIGRWAASMRPTT